jgi:hypothetical protein
MMRLCSWVAALLMTVDATAYAQVQEDEIESGARIGQFRGYAAVNVLVMERLLDPVEQSNRYFELARFFGEQYIMDGGLWSLLGSYSGTGTTSDFRNGTPNGVNMLLWHLGFSSFSAAMGKVCTNKSPAITPSPEIPQFVLSAPVFATMNALCDAGDNAERRAQALAAIWMAVHAYDLPEDEMQAYVAFFNQDPAFLAATPAARLAMAMHGALVNPLFLLER